MQVPKVPAKKKGRFSSWILWCPFAASGANAWQTRKMPILHVRTYSACQFRSHWDLRYSRWSLVSIYTSSSFLFPSLLRSLLYKLIRSQHLFANRGLFLGLCSPWHLCKAMRFHLWCPTFFSHRWALSRSSCASFQYTFWVGRWKPTTFSALFLL